MHVCPIALLSAVCAASSPSPAVPAVCTKQGVSSKQIVPLQVVLCMSLPVQAFLLSGLQSIAPVLLSVPHAVLVAVCLASTAPPTCTTSLWCRPFTVMKHEICFHLAFGSLVLYWPMPYIHCDEAMPILEMHRSLKVYCHGPHAEELLWMTSMDITSSANT